MSSSKLFCSFLIMCMAYLAAATGKRHMHNVGFNQEIDSDWYDAHATFYGDIEGGGTTYGACGYGDVFKHGYGLETTALSTALYNDGLTCGACFEIKCVNDPQWCYPNVTINVTVIDICLPNSAGGWCQPPRKHFDLSKLMFTKLVPELAGVIPIQYRRILCSKKGGVQFHMYGYAYSTSVLLYNVGGVGDVKDVKIKGSKTGWIQLHRNFGVDWSTSIALTGQSLSFQVTASDGKLLEFADVAPANWHSNQVFDGKINF